VRPWKALTNINLINSEEIFKALLWRHILLILIANFGRYLGNDLKYIPALRASQAEGKKMFFKNIITIKQNDILKI